jgi:hypothetical protein
MTRAELRPVTGDELCQVQGGFLDVFKTIGKAVGSAVGGYFERLGRGLLPVAKAAKHYLFPYL